MDVSALNDISVRRKAIANVGKIKQKLSEETSRIIKLRVKQDATYWELREKYSELERNHERLQQNMIQLQMEYETLSSQYQEEKRRRPEALNMLTSNRKIYEVLEENLNSVRAALQRSAADRNALAEAYAQASEKVTAVQADYVSQINAANNATREAQDLAKLKDEQCTRLSECMGLISCHAEETKAELQHVREQRDCLAEKMAGYTAQIQEKEKNIQELRAEIQRASTEYNERMEKQRQIAADLEREAGAATALREALAQTESHCEMLTREGKRLENQNQELKSVYEETKRTMNFMVNKTEQIVKELNAKTQKIQALEDALAKSKQETQTATEGNLQLINELERERREFEQRITTANDELERQCEENDRIAEEYKRDRNDFQNKITSHELNLNKCNEVIATLKLEIQELKKTRDDSHVTIAELNTVIERERSNENERIVDLERSLTEKEEMIKSLLDTLTINKEEVANANIAIEEQKAELVRKNNDFEEHKTAFEIKMAESKEANAQLKRDLAEETSKLTRAEETLNTIRAELKAARADAAHAMDNVRRLETAIRNKDDEASEQLKIVQTARAENEQLQQKIRELQATIKDIQKMTHPEPKTPVPVPVAAHREPPEHDHTARDVSHTPLKQEAKKTRQFSPVSSRRPTQPAAADHKELIYNLFSDTDNSIDNLDIKGRFEAMSRGIPLTPIYQNTNRRPRKTAKAAAPVTEPVQVRTEPQQVQKEPKRKFFKSKRLKPC